MVGGSLGEYNLKESNEERINKLKRSSGEEDSGEEILKREKKRNKEEGK